jgi:bifunctional DNase/RNase
MKCQLCQAAATLHISDFIGRALVGERHLCEKDAHQILQSHPPPPQKADWRRPAEGVVAAHTVEGFTGDWQARPRPTPTAEVEVDVSRVIISEIHEQQVVVLREVGGDRSFPIMIGIFEATGLDRTLKNLPSPRPLTHDAWAATITALGGEVQDVLIGDLRDHTYYAEVRMRQAGRLVPVDVRPSDAFVLACKCGVPILIAEQVLSEVCG